MNPPDHCGYRMETLVATDAYYCVECQAVIPFTPAEIIAREILTDPESEFLGGPIDLAEQIITALAEAGWSLAYIGEAGEFVGKDLDGGVRFTGSLGIHEIVGPANDPKLPTGNQE